MEEVPLPEIEKGEFDFTVTYEYDGKVKTISGVYVCEFAGLDFALDGGWSREWVGYIKDSDMEDMIPLGTSPDGEVIHLHLSFVPEYFMGDPTAVAYDVPKPDISVNVKSEEGIAIMNDPAEIEEYCGAKIISYEYEEPIKNTFK